MNTLIVVSLLLFLVSVSTATLSHEQQVKKLQTEGQQFLDKEVHLKDDVRMDRQQTRQVW